MEQCPLFPPSAPDIVGFTEFCGASDPFTVMAFLNDLYSRFDSLVDIYKVS